MHTPTFSPVVLNTKIRHQDTDTQKRGKRTNQKVEQQGISTTLQLVANKIIDLYCPLKKLNYTTAEIGYKLEI